MKKIAIFLAVAMLCLGLSAAVSEKTASYGLLLSDNGNTIVMNSSSNLIVYLPSLGTDNIGYTITIMKKGTGQVKIQAPLADYVGDSAANGYLQNTTASTDASVTLHLGKLHYWYITGATGVWATAVSSSPYGVESPTYGTVYATTFDTNVAAAGVTLSGITLAADGTDSNIDITLTPKGTGEVNLPKVDIDAGVAQLATLGVDNLSNNLVYVDGTRTDTYTADGSMLLPYKTVLAALTVINADTGKSWVINVAPGTYADNLTITGPRYLRIEGCGGVVLSGTILINSAVGSYDRVEFVGAAAGQNDKGPALTISGAITLNRTNDSLFYLVFNGCYVSGAISAAGSSGTWTTHCINSRMSGAITGPDFGYGTEVINLYSYGQTKFSGTISSKVNLYHCMDTEFSGTINTVPQHIQRIIGCAFTGAVTMAATGALVCYVDSVSLKAIVDRTPTLTNVTLSNLDYVGTETYAGINELATTAEAVTGTASDKVVTPAGITAHLAAPQPIGMTTPAAGNFTTIGVTTQGTGAFTTISGTTITGTTFTTGGLGAAAATGNVAVENAVGTVHSTVLTLTNVDIAPAAAGAGIAFANVKLYDFPAGHVYFLGAVADLSLTDTISAGAEMAGNFTTWTVPGAPATWDYDVSTAGAWHHATGDATALTTDVVPVAGTTYTVTVTMATSTAGGGLVISMGGITQSEVHGTATETWTFTASDATALVLTPASGTWVGDVTAVTVNTVTPVSATWNGDVAFGTAADADGSLAGTEVDLVAKTATPAAVAGVATADCQSTATEQTILDGHSVAKDLILNLLIDAGDFIDAGTGALHLNGTVTITWINLGDN